MNFNLINLFLTLLLISVTISSVGVWDSCPFGLVDDPYPGECSRYVDSDGDSLCDRSQSAPSGDSIVNGFESSEGIDGGLAQISELTGENIQYLTMGQIADHYDIPQEVFLSNVKEHFNLDALEADEKLLAVHDEQGVCAEELMYLAGTMSGDLTKEQKAYLELPGSQIKTMSVQQVADHYGIDVDEFLKQIAEEFGLNSVEAKDQFQLLHDNYEVRPSIVKEIAASMVAQKDVSLLPINKQSYSSSTIDTLDSPEKKTVRYDFWWLVVLILGIYTVTRYLAHIKKMTLFTHRHIWNAVLLIFTLSMGLTGIYLWLKITYGLIIQFPVNILNLHVATGIGMAIVVFFHVLDHVPYLMTYCKYFQKKDCDLMASKAQVDECKQKELSDHRHWGGHKSKIQ